MFTTEHWRGNLRLLYFYEEKTNYRNLDQKCCSFLIVNGNFRQPAGSPNKYAQLIVIGNDEFHFNNCNTFSIIYIIIYEDRQSKCNLDKRDFVHKTKTKTKT